MSVNIILPYEYDILIVPTTGCAADSANSGYGPSPRIVTDRRSCNGDIRIHFPSWVYQGGHEALVPRRQDEGEPRVFVLCFALVWLGTAGPWSHHSIIMSLYRVCTLYICNIHSGVLAIYLSLFLIHSCFNDLVFCFLVFGAFILTSPETASWCFYVKF